MEFKEERALVASTMGRLYKRGLTTATGGNVSMRSGDYMFITPSGKDKDSLTFEDIAILNVKTGEQIITSYKLSIESEMH